MPDLIETGKNRTRSNTALLVVDMITDFDFEDGNELFRNTIKIAGNIASLKRQANQNNVPVIFVNDNFGRWQTAFPNYVSTLRAASQRASEILDIVEPTEDDYYIVKPQRSGFYATGLSVLLMSLNITNVIVTGVTTDICVLFTAHDAYMRGYDVAVPGDCCAAVHDSYHREAISYLKRVAEADTSPHTSITFTTVERATDQSWSIINGSRGGKWMMGSGQLEFGS